MSTRAQHATAVLHIDLDAICDNYRLLRQQAGRAHCAAVLKADAYGVGAAQVGAALAGAGCRHFFVAHLDEAIALRPHVPGDASVFVLHGPPPRSEKAFVHHRLTPVLNSLQQIAAWHALAREIGAPLPAIIQVDTGMSRMGLSEREIDLWLADPEFSRSTPLLYLMSHLACADEPDNPMNRLQLQRFKHLRMRIGAPPASLANSSGIFLGDAFQFDLVRPGAALYGVAPAQGQPNPLRQVLKLQAPISQVRTIQAGDYVGYGMGFRAERQSRIATVQVGYADGWLRSMSNRGRVGLRDGIAPLVGKVSMDSITLDVTDIDERDVNEGTLVDLIGELNPVDQVALQAGTIAYEVLTSLGNRYRRQYHC